MLKLHYYLAPKKVLGLRFTAAVFTGLIDTRKSAMVRKISHILLIRNRRLFFVLIMEET